MASSSRADLRIPDLRFVPVETLVPHEQYDESRLEALVRRIREQAVLKNPPVVAPLGADDRGNGRYVVLDGANRATAARAAGLPHLVVQVVPYLGPEVQLSTWFHALGDYPRADLEGALARVSGLEYEPTQRVHASALLARREALACVVYADGVVAALHGGRDIRERNALLNAVVDTYRDRTRFYRVTSDSLESARAAHPEVTAIVVFPHFEPAEILELAGGGERLPAGITRHLIQGRALRINIPLERLADRSQSLDAKNQWLEGWLKEKIAGRQVRLYVESTILFDE